LNDAKNKIRSTRPLIEGARERTEYVPRDNYETEKITRKASEAAENLQCLVHLPEIVMHDESTTHLMLFSERPLICVSCMTISEEEPNNSI